MPHNPCIDPRSCYVWNHCREPECIAANQDYHREVYVMNARRAGRVVRPRIEYVDPGPAAQHIHDLRAQGMGSVTIGRACGIDQRVVQLIASGARKRIHRTTEERILAVELAPAWVDVTGAARRLQALSAVGYTLAVLHEETGIRAAHLSRIMVGGVRVVRRGTHEVVAEVFDRLAMKQGPSAESKRRAAAKGWAPPLAWDEDSIDAPDAQPDYGHKKRGFDLDEWRFIVQGGEDPERAAERCGVTITAVERAAYREGRRDITAITTRFRHRNRWSAA